MATKGLGQYHGRFCVRHEADMRTNLFAGLTAVHLYESAAVFFECRQVCDSPQPDGLNLLDKCFRQFCRGVVDPDGHLYHNSSCNEAVAFQCSQSGRQRFLADALQSFQQAGEAKRPITTKLCQDPEAPLVQQSRQKRAQFMLLACRHPGADVADVGVRTRRFYVSPRCYLKVPDCERIQEAG